MSFILDALRKAETKNRDRHSLTVPAGPRVLNEELPEAPPTRPAWIWVAVAGLLAAALVWWFLPDPTSTAPPGISAPAGSDQPDQQPAVAQRESQAPAPGNAFPAELPNVQRETGARALDREARRGVVQRSTASPSSQNSSAGSIAGSSFNDASQRVTPGTVTILQPDGSLPVDTQASSMDPTGPVSGADSTSVRTTGSVQTEALPEYLTALASGEVPIPRLHLDMHVYSAQPAKRFVFINLDKYGEGDSIDRDTRVESIEPNGAVINHKGYRFVLRPE